MTATHTDSKPREQFLVALVFLLVIGANIPPHLLVEIGIAREIVLSVLGVLIVLALFLYLRFFFFILYVLLIVGANLPDHWAQTLQIERVPLIITLICMVIGSSLNYVGYFVPTGLGKRPLRDNKEALDALMRAIGRQQMLRITAILEMEFNLDQADESGDTPLLAAVKSGDVRIVQALINAGANQNIAGPDGSALEYAQRSGNATIVAILSPTPMGATTQSTGPVVTGSPALTAS